MGRDEREMAIARGGKEGVREEEKGAHQKTGRQES